MQVDNDERRKADFVREYRQLCEKHNMLVAMHENADNTYHAFIVVDIAADPSALTKSVEEMLIEDLLINK